MCLTGIQLKSEGFIDLGIINGWKKAPKIFLDCDDCDHNHYPLRYYKPDEILRIYYCQTCKFFYYVDIS